jgi:hypothetical protein
LEIRSPWAWATLSNLSALHSLSPTNITPDAPGSRASDCCGKHRSSECTQDIATSHMTKGTYVKTTDMNVLNVFSLVNNRVRGYNTNERHERFERFSGSCPRYPLFDFFLQELSDG